MRFLSCTHLKVVCPVFTLASVSSAYVIGSDGAMYFVSRLWRCFFVRWTEVEFWPDRGVVDTPLPKGNLQYITDRAAVT